ncbi:O-antigen ligase family protein [Chitinimonas koreensis]|uniref:O-antigen ligase family protein n=1 Tax=Chitinimonas koreensis TaxID=356302 RepID=UPI0003F67974|nr:O-antigen ligase family protein [Chitinimonas koreensis]QNM96920.1 O-antigen ligase family protein [Chitinimonas koreensis]
MSVSRSAWLGGLAALALFAQPALLAGWPAGSRGLALWLCLIGLLMAGWQRRQARHGVADRGPADRGPADPLAAQAGLAFLLFALALALAHLFNPAASTDHRRIVDALLAGGALCFAARTRGQAGAWWAGCAAAAIAMALQSGYEVYVLGAERARGYHFWVSWGSLGLMLGLLPLSARPPGWRHGWRRALLWAGAAGGLATAWLSGSRSVWLAAAALAVWRLGRRRPAALWALALGALLLLAATGLAPSGAQRWQMALSDLQQYRGGNADTSLGLRLLMWQEAFAAWQQAPWFGLGVGGFQDWLAAAVAQGRGPASLLTHGHAHNEALNALVSAGLLGLAATVLLLWLPWRAFARREAEARDPAAAAAARGGKTLVLAMALLGLADTLLLHGFLLGWYAIAAMLLLGWSAPAGRGKT